MTKTLGGLEMCKGESCSPAIGGGYALQAESAFGETMIPASSMAPLQRSNTEFPGEHGCMDDDADLHAATMRVDSDET